MPFTHLARGLASAGPRAFLAIPTATGVEPNCFASVVEASVLLTAAGIGFDLAVEEGNCHVDDARNSLVRLFLQTDCTDFVFIDADVGFEADDLVRLLRFDADVVGGVYPKKSDEEDYPVYVEPGTTLQARPDGLVEVHGLPTGFMRIRRHVLEKLVERAVKFTGSNGEEYPVVFERVISGGRRWSGDYAFCQKWRKLGGKLYTDPLMRFSHSGPKTWRGSLGPWWRRKHGVVDMAFAGAVAALKQGSPTDADFAALHEGWPGEWKGGPALLRACWETPGAVLEFGSGLTTLVLAARGPVTAVEHDPVWAAYLAQTLARFGLEADVRLAPLVDGFYDIDLPAEHEAILVDGPPRSLGDRSKALRYHARRWLWDDYDLDIPGAEIVEADGKRFARWRSTPTPTS